VPPVPDSHEQVVELIAKACSEHTKVLTFTEVSNVTGCTLLARRCIKADLQGRRQLHQANAESRGTLPVGVSMGLTHT
jgi:hypothetical protein